MRKILTVFGTLSIISTISINTIACNNVGEDILKYEINDQGEIIYNFQQNQAYVIGFTIKGIIKEINIYVKKIPFSAVIYGDMTQYRTIININETKAWTTGWYRNNLIYLKQGNKNLDI